MIPQHIWAGRRKNPWTCRGKKQKNKKKRKKLFRLGIRKEKKNEDWWLQAKYYAELHQVDKHVQNGSFWGRRERIALKKMFKINGLKLSKLDGRLPIKGGLGLHERIFHDTDVVTQFSQIAEILRERGSD